MGIELLKPWPPESKAFSWVHCVRNTNTKYFVSEPQNNVLFLFFIIIKILLCRLTVENEFVILFYYLLHRYDKENVPIPS